MRCVPDTIAARFALANVLGLVVFEIVWLGFLWFQGAASERTEHMLPARIGDVTQLAETIPPADRSDILSRLDVGIQRTPAAVEPETGPSTYALRWRISAAVADHAIVVWQAHSGRPKLCQSRRGTCGRATSGGGVAHPGSVV
jgi:hypothetical protein